MIGLAEKTCQQDPAISAIGAKIKYVVDDLDSQSHVSEYSGTYACGTNKAKDTVAKNTFPPH